MIFNLKSNYTKGNKMELESKVKLLKILTLSLHVLIESIEQKNINETFKKNMYVLMEIFKEEAAIESFKEEECDEIANTLLTLFLHYENIVSNSRYHNDNGTVCNDIFFIIYTKIFQLLMLRTNCEKNREIIENSIINHIKIVDTMLKNLKEKVPFDVIMNIVIAMDIVYKENLIDFDLFFKLSQAMVVKYFPETLTHYNENMYHEELKEYFFKGVAAINGTTQEEDTKAIDYLNYRHATNYIITGINLYSLYAKELELSDENQQLLMNMVYLQFEKKYGSLIENE